MTYYVLNVQGDVTGLIDGDGNLLICYLYEGFGEGYYTADTSNQTAVLASTNPLGYRGYVMDAGTGLYYLQSRYYDPTLGRFLNMDGVTSGANGSIHGYNVFAYCFNNPINLTDKTGSWPSWNDIKSGLEEIADWIEENIIQPIEEFADDIAEDCTNYDNSNTSVEHVMESNYFSSYNGTLVIRHSSETLTSWTYGGVICLNHDLDDQTKTYQEQMVKHEYGHALQEDYYGTLQYTFLVFIPSATYNLLSRSNENLSNNYYNMPWEYDADLRGGVNRYHASWAETAHFIYFFFLER